jgi:hypothetical protein
MTYRLLRQLPSILPAIFIIIAAWSQDDFASKKAVSVRSAEDVIRVWTPNQHVYVKGNLGLGNQQLTELEDWLQKNGPHWTVVLMEQAQDERYSSQDGRTFAGLDAVEFALGHGLANRTKFGSLEHPQTGETDGCVFVLFLRERKFSYYGSDTQDRRGIGESAWLGNLDREAIQAMRNGGRIIDAVKNTVETVNSRLEKSLAREAEAAREAKAAAERAKLERQRAVQNASQRIEEIQSKLLPEVTATITKFKSDFPGAADSDMGKQTTAEWERPLNEVLQNLTEENVREQNQKIEKIEADVIRVLGIYADHQNFSKLLAEWETRWDTLAFHTGLEVAISYTKESRELLDHAKTQHQLGNSEFSTSLTMASKAIQAGEAAVVQALEAQEKVKQQRTLIRRTLWIAAGGLGLVLMLIFALLNWRRRGALQRAVEEFEKRHDSAAREAEAVAQVLQLRDEAVQAAGVGTKTDLTGMTASLIKDIESQANSLAEMHREISRVTAAARSLLHPGFIGELFNLISSTRFLALINLLNGKSLDGSPANLKNEIDGGQWLTFDQFVSEFRRLRANCLAAITRLKTAVEQCLPSLIEIKTLVTQLESITGQLKAAERTDNRLQLNAVDGVLLPSIEGLLAEAEAKLERDPVQGFEQTLPKAKQQSADGLAIAEIICQTRNELFPILDVAAAQLRKHVHRVDWIGKAVSELTEQANQLLDAAVTASQTAGIERLAAAVSTLKDRAQQTATLAREMDEKSELAVQAVKSQLKTGRQKIASLLKLAESQVIAEEGYNPDQVLVGIEKQLTAAQAALDSGLPEVASNALQAAAIESARGESLIQDSLAVAQEYPTRSAHSLDQLSKVTRFVADVQRKVAQSREQFTDSALRLQPFDEDFGDESNTTPTDSGILAENTQLIDVSEAIQRAETLLLASQQSIEASAPLYRKANLLEAANVLHLADQDITSSQTILQAVEKHVADLPMAAQQNQKLGEEIKNQLAALQGHVDDARSEPDSIQQFQKFMSEIDQLRIRLKKPAGRLDPFADRRDLNHWNSNVAAIGQELEADFRGFSEAVLAVKGALGELVTCQNLVERSVRDQIPDSRVIVQSQQQIEEYKQYINRLALRLKEPHQKWDEIQATAGKANSDLGIVAGRLERELGLAELASEAFQRASDAVYRASQWVGSYSIRIRQNFGSNELEQSRVLLAEGNYKTSTELSTRAEQIALKAIAEADAEVARKRASEARRRSHSSSGSIFTSLGSGSSGGSWSSGGGSWSSGGGSWSSGGSSSSGGGSGFGRSGW